AYRQLARVEWRNGTHKYLSPKRLAALNRQLITYAEEHGYPFAQVYLDSLRLEDSSTISASLRLKLDAQYKIDSIALTSTTRISPRFMYRHLEIFPGDVYNEKKINQVSNKIRGLRFLKEKTPWTIYFREGYSRLNLNLEEKKSNQLSAIVGLQPNAESTNKFLLTVDALFAFHNLLGQGEFFSVSYKNLQQRSPKLMVQLNAPYLGGTAFGADVEFEYYKNDLNFR